MELAGATQWLSHRQTDALRPTARSQSDTDHSTEARDDRKAKPSCRTHREPAAIPSPSSPLQNILGTDATGERFAKLIELTSSMGEDAMMMEQYRQYLGQLRKMPSFAKDLVQAYERLTGHNEYEIERAGLLELMVDSPVDRRQIRDRAEREMINRDEEKASEEDEEADRAMILPICRSRSVP